DFESAQAMCQDSYAIAAALGNDELAAEAMNGLGAVHIERGDPAAAVDVLERALATSGHPPALRGRIEQNLGIVANIRGDYGMALARYAASLEAFRAAQD